MKIYIDESNINLSKLNSEEKFYISSAAVFHDKQMIEKAIRIKERHGIITEIKGSDLMTKKNTVLRREIVEEIFPLVRG